jgi:glycosyltransferase involved in cell wall biosynthesis
MSRTPRVLLVVEQLQRRVPGGIGTSVRGLLQGLTAVGSPLSASPKASSVSRAQVPQVTLYASRARRANPSSSSEPFGPLPVVRSSLPGPLMTRAWDHGLCRVGAGYDVVHTTSFAVPPTPRARKGPRTIVTVHDLIWRKVPEAFPSRGRRWHEHSLSRVLDSDALLVTATNQVAQELLEAGASSDRLVVIPFGSDHLPEPDHRSADGVLRRLGIEDGFLLSVGTLEPRKNLGRLFDAYRRAQGELPKPVPLLVVGPSGWGADSEPVPGVAFAGSTDGATLAALYQRARLLVYVPLAEGFGFPPVEAMRQGTPVVASPVPSSNGATFEVDPLQVDEIAGALVRVSVDEELRSSLVRSGIAHSDALTWAATAEKHLELWESLGD